MLTGFPWATTGSGSAQMMGMGSVSERESELQSRYSLCLSFPWFSALGPLVHVFIDQFKIPLLHLPDALAGMGVLYCAQGGGGTWDPWG